MEDLKEFSDLVILVDGKEVYTSAYLLASFSPIIKVIDKCRIIYAELFENLLLVTSN